MKNKLTPTELQKRFNALPTSEHYEAIQKAEESLSRIFFTFARENLTDDTEFLKQYDEAHTELINRTTSEPLFAFSSMDVLQNLCISLAFWKE